MHTHILLLTYICSNIWIGSGSFAFLPLNSLQHSPQKYFIPIFFCTEILFTSLFLTLTSKSRLLFSHFLHQHSTFFLSAALSAPRVVHIIFSLTFPPSLLNLFHSSQAETPHIHILMSRLTYMKGMYKKKKRLDRYYQALQFSHVLYFVFVTVFNCMCVACLLPYNVLNFTILWCVCGYLCLCQKFFLRNFILRVFLSLEFKKPQLKQADFLTILVTCTDRINKMIKQKAPNSPVRVPCSVLL